jgi:hypothetical protein
MKFVISLFIICSIVPCYTQVNTEVFRNSQDKNGLSGNIGISTQFNSGNSDFLNIGLNFRLDFKSDINNTFLVSNYERVSGNNVLVSNRGFTHLRTSFPVNSFLDAEAFVQKEFNDFILLKDRQLLGVSSRFQVLNITTDSITAKTSTVTFGNIYLSQGVYYEKEFLDVEVDTITTIYRSSTTFTTVIQLQQYVQLSLSSYFQFDVNRFADHRILLNSSLKFKLFSNLNYLVGVMYRYDSEPPSAAIRLFDFSLSNGISYSF